MREERAVGDLVDGAAFKCLKTCANRIHMFGIDGVTGDVERHAARFRVHHVECGDHGTRPRDRGNDCATCVQCGGDVHAQNDRIAGTCRSHIRKLRLLFGAWDPSRVTSATF